MSNPAATMDDICALIVAHPNALAVQQTVLPNLRKLENTRLTKDPKGPLLLQSALSTGEDPLVVLMPQTATVGYLIILSARLTGAIELRELLPFVLRFTEQMDVQQLQLVPHEVDFLMKQLYHLGRVSTQMELAILPMKIIMDRCIPPGTLTACHAVFLQAVLDTRMFEAARYILSFDMMDLDHAAFPIKYQDSLLYFYFGGVVLAMLGLYSRSIEFLEMCVSSPGAAASAIQIDAYKKLVLVQLLHEGKIHALPKYTSASVVTACKNYCGVYLDYAGAYSAHDSTKMTAIYDKNIELFTKDHNVGLIHLCTRVFRRRMIQKLTDTYISLSLSDIAKAVSLPLDEAGLREAHAEIQRMLADGSIFGSMASIDGADLASVTVTFIDDPQEFNDHATVQRVTNAIERAQNLDRILSANNSQVASGKDFIVKVYNSSAAPSVQSMGLNDFSSAPDWEQEDDS